MFDFKSSWPLRGSSMFVVLLLCQIMTWHGASGNGDGRLVHDGLIGAGPGFTNYYVNTQGTDNPNFVRFGHTLWVQVTGDIQAIFDDELWGVWDDYFRKSLYESVGADCSHGDRVRILYAYVDWDLPFDSYLSMSEHFFAHAPVVLPVRVIMECNKCDPSQVRLIAGSPDDDGVEDGVDRRRHLKNQQRKLGVEIVSHDSMRRYEHRRLERNLIDPRVEFRWFCTGADYWPFVDNFENALEGTDLVNAEDDMPGYIEEVHSVIDPYYSDEFCNSEIQSETLFNYTFYFTAQAGLPSGFTPEILDRISSLFVAAYNEVNALNWEVCDYEGRIARSATFEPPDEVWSFGETVTFKVVISGTCLDCPTFGCLMEFPYDQPVELDFDDLILLRPQQEEGNGVRDGNIGEQHDASQGGNGNLRGSSRYDTIDNYDLYSVRDNVANERLSTTRDDRTNSIGSIQDKILDSRASIREAPSVDRNDPYAFTGHPPRSLQQQEEIMEEDFHRLLIEDQTDFNYTDSNYTDYNYTDFNITDLFGNFTSGECICSEYAYKGIPTLDDFLEKFIVAFQVLDIPNAPGFFIGIPEEIWEGDERCTTCCGYPDRGYPPVPPGAIYRAVDDYFLTGDSPHGPALNCFDVSEVTSLNELFSIDRTNPLFDANYPEEDISCWDTSKVVSMNKVFKGQTTFNLDISKWNTENVQEMGNIFDGCSNFNIPIGDWDVSKVTTFYGAFMGTPSFNQPLGDWNTSSCDDMGLMFKGSAFNQPIGNWTVDKALYLDFMFNGAFSFNQDISNWTPVAGDFFEQMFFSATMFRQDLCAWGQYVNPQAGFSNMFKNTACPTDFSPTGANGPWCFNCV